MKEIKVVVKEDTKVIETKKFETWKEAVWNILDELSETYEEHYDNDELCFEDAENKYWGQPDGVNFWIKVLSVDNEPINITYKIILDKIYNKITENLKIDFENDWLTDNYETDTAVTKETLSEYSEEEIEICKMDWIHSIKENFLSVSIAELTKDSEDDFEEEEFYEVFYEDVYNYLIDKTFKKEEK